MGNLSLVGDDYGIDDVDDSIRSVDICLGHCWYATFFIFENDRAISEARFENVSTYRFDGKLSSGSFDGIDYISGFKLTRDDVIS